MIDTTKYQLRGDRILIRRDPETEQTPGGIAIPQQAREIPRAATILLVGDEVTGYEAGQRILTALGAGSDIELDHERLHLIQPKHVFFVVA